MPTLQALTPTQGQGSFAAVADAIQYAPSAAIAVSSAANALTIPQLAIDGAVAAAAGTITVNVTNATAGKYDRAQLVVARYGEIVDAVALDPAMLSGTSGSVTMPNLPAGTTATPDKAAFYYGFVRVWKSTNHGVRVHVLPITTYADFRTSNAATWSVMLP